MVPEYLYVNSGDELKFNVKLVINGKPYRLQRGEKVWFDVKKYTYGTEETPVLIHVEQLDTKIYIPRVDLEPGDYIFDIGVIHADGTTKTVIPCIRNNVNKLIVGKRVYDPSMLRMAINIDNNKAIIDRFSSPDGGSMEEEIRQLYDITAELTDDFRKTFIVVQTMAELNELPKENLINGRVVKVVNGNNQGKESYYSFNYEKQEFEKFSFVSDPRAFITVDTANDLIMIPSSELVHGKLVRVNRPKSNDDDNIPDIVEDPKDYYKPAYYSYDSVGNQWVLVNFGGSKVTEPIMFVADEAAMLALTDIEAGQQVYREDKHTVWIFKDGDASQLANWVESAAQNDTVWNGTTNKVGFHSMTQTEYDELAAKDTNTLYVTDAGRMYKGDLDLTSILTVVSNIDPIPPYSKELAYKLIIQPYDPGWPEHDPEYYDANPGIRILTYDIDSEELVPLIPEFLANDINWADADSKKLATIGLIKKGIKESIEAIKLNTSFDKTSGTVTVGAGTGAELTGVAHDVTYDQSNLKITIPVFGGEDVVVNIPKQIQSDYEQNDSAAADYIKNRPFCVDGYTVGPLYNKTELTFDIDEEAGISSCEIPGVRLSLVEGQTYTVNFDNVDYIVQSHILEAEEGHSIGLGNLHFMDEALSDTGEPFILLYNEYSENEYSLVIATNIVDSTTHTLAIQTLVEHIVKLDNKFLDLSDYVKNEALLDYAKKTDLSGKMNSSNPTGSGSFSLNRRAGSLIGGFSFSEGSDTIASGSYSHAEGYGTTASGTHSHAEGGTTNALGNYSHAEGNATFASGNYSHAEGGGTAAGGEYSHAEGGATAASGIFSHAEGSGTRASGQYSHAEGSTTTASGDYSHAEGSNTIASSNVQHVQGKYNIEDSSNIYADIIGNGNKNGNTNNRSNAATVDWQGNAWYAGDVYVGSTSGTNKDAGSKKLATEEYVNSVKCIIPSSTIGSTKKFKITVDDSGAISATEVT